MIWRQVLTWDVSTEPEVGSLVKVLFGRRWFHDTRVSDPDDVLHELGVIVGIEEPQYGRPYHVRWPGGDEFWLKRTEFAVMG